MKETVVALTTHDNPYDPIDNFSEWCRYDLDHGYDTCGYLMRIAKPTDALTDKEELRVLEDAIDEILEFDFENKYKKIKREIEESSE